jgi:Rrf2 family protein
MTLGALWGRQKLGYGPAHFNRCRIAVLSQKAKYALKALLALAAVPEGDLLQGGDIAEQQRIPKKFLDLILLELRKHGLVESARGKKGGYALARRPEDITVGRIIRAVDGPLAPIACASVSAYRRCPDCDNEKTCAVRRLMRDVRDAAAGILDHVSLADAAAATLSKSRRAKRAA